MALILLALCLVLAVATFAATSTRARIALGSAFFLTACGDFVAGLAYHRYLCATQADSVILSTEVGVEGFFSPYFSAPLDSPKATGTKEIVDYLKESGYAWVEGVEGCAFDTTRCRHVRYRLAEDSKLSREAIDSPTRFMITLHKYPVLAGLVEVVEGRIEDRKNQTVLARDRGYSHVGGWLFHGYDDSSRGCWPRETIADRVGIQRVLVPVGRKT